MITNKDIRVENGFLIINGDKYPLDGQSPETIMEIVEDNSDTTPTENSTAPVTSGGVYTADKAISDTIGDITQTGVTGADVAAQIAALDAALTAHDNTTVQQLNIYKSNNVVYLYGYINNLDTTQTIIAYATLDAKYKPASGYAIGFLISATAPYLPVGSVWVNGSTGGVHIYKEAATTEGYICLAYLA